MQKLHPWGMGLVNLPDAFFRHAKSTPESPALWVGGSVYTYGELSARARAFADSQVEPGQTLVPIVARQHVDAYAAILGALWAGAAYVPIPEEPESRAEKIRASIEDGDGSGLAYIIFTSGSTGEPKGVPISHENALCYVSNAQGILGLGPDDRASNMHDLTFDFSVQDLWVPWSAGACVYVVPKRERFAPAAFINQHRLTLWSAVPSVAGSMQRMKLLERDSLPTLNNVVFCGEALPELLASHVAHAAPDAEVWNFYGPTECTVAVTAQRVRRLRWVEGTVPIGTVFDRHSYRIVDGELHVGGPQVAHGYWNDLPRTRESFYRDGGTWWYRTGDLVDERDGVLHYRGRKDHQVQVRGHRVEPGEVEAVLRDIVGHSRVACVAEDIGGRLHIVAYVEGPETPSPSTMRERLPEYMVPTVVERGTLPLTRNGKIDRRELVCAT